MKYLGVDFGLAHIGVALADGPLAEPWGEKKYQSPKQLFNYLKRICDENLIDQIVVGLPEGRLETAARNFGGRLERVTGRRVFFQDETLTTVEAKARLLAAGRGKMRRRRDHSAAAALILQEYLDMIEAGGKDV